MPSDGDVDRRRDVRFRLQVPLSMEWIDSAGQKISEEAVTQVVNSYGCLTSLVSSVEEGMEVTCTNRANKQSRAARIICVGALDTDGRRTVGLELLEASGEFWG